MAYLHAVDRSFTWCERDRIDELAGIEPLRVAAYIEALENNFEKPTVKQHLAAIGLLLSPTLTLPQPYPLT